MKYILLFYFFLSLTGFSCIEPKTLRLPTGGYLFPSTSGGFGRGYLGVGMNGSPELSFYTDDEANSTMKIQNSTGFEIMGALGVLERLDLDLVGTYQGLTFQWLGTPNGSEGFKSTVFVSIPVAFRSKGASMSGSEIISETTIRGQKLAVSLGYLFPERGAIYLSLGNIQFAGSSQKENISWPESGRTTIATLGFETRSLTTNESRMFYALEAGTTYTVWSRGSYSKTDSFVQGWVGVAFDWDQIRKGFELDESKSEGED